MGNDELARTVDTSNEWIVGRTGIRERRIAGCSDHLRSELVELLTLAGDGKLLLQEAISGRVPLDAGAINGVLDELERGTPTLRRVITTDR